MFDAILECENFSHLFLKHLFYMLKIFYGLYFYFV